MCSSFLLGIVNEGHDKESKLWSILGRTFGEQRDDLDMDLLIEQLKVHGAQEQLLMFLTGPAGAGKSTAMKVATRFCFEFCFSLGVIWNEWTIFFTAYTGSAAIGHWWIHNMQVCIHFREAGTYRRRHENMEGGTNPGH